jgi:outer membrane protein assembly factor BamB
MWVSRDLLNPAPPVITSDVVIALSGGDAQNHAVLYVLDASNGKELYSSKDEVPTYTHLSGVSFGSSHAYFTDHDHVLYAFGIGMEH